MLNAIRKSKSQLNWAELNPIEISLERYQDEHVEYK